MEDVLHQNQYCGRNGKTIYDAVVTVRDIIAYAEDTNISICVLSIDFSDAFDKISHTYLFEILREKGIISANFCQCLRNIYADSTSILTMNGHKSKPIKILSGVQQRCPLSMLLIETCINPLLINLDRKLQGIKVRHNSNKTTAIAYADDITIIIRHPDEIDDIREILQDYMKATGAHINENKSHAPALGSWTKSVPIVNIKYDDNIKILGFHMTTNSKNSAKLSRAMLTTKIRTQAQDNYHRALNLESRIRYVVILATAWYTTRIPPPPTNCVRQINAALSYFI